MVPINSLPAKSAAAYTAPVLPVVECQPGVMILIFVKKQDRIVLHVGVRVDMLDNLPLSVYHIYSVENRAEQIVTVLLLNSAIDV